MERNFIEDEGIENILICKFFEVTGYKLVIAGGLAYALGMKPYLRVLGA